ncbi:hypothetical protein EHH44_14020 [Mycolicibacter terrae]|uniref:Transmembrane protein n=2 Tax=Mycolicibacter TaxID=1073531 RepID=A0A1A2XM12_MYCSD|nr:MULTISPECIES: hypothetical protein [Mycolicibacter]OBH18471.1 hypothetical protein A5694_21495 [Mycolicibacter sinensis]OBI25941.1 hypothetical protein A5710_07985 [Mycolicibacter sinensis]RRR43541.1 hypothetical protein EHH44_14020 [Mycolicibacter terrae]
MTTKRSESDLDVWRRATWLIPVAIQPTLALLAVVTSLLTDRLLGPDLGFRAVVLIATAITTAVSAAIGVALTPSASVRRRAFGFSLVGSGLAVLIGATTYALFLMLPSDAAVR